MNLLETLRDQGIDLIPEGDVLRLRGPASKITDEVRQLIAAHKTDLLAALQREAIQRPLLSYDQLAEGIRYSRTHEELEEFLEQINAHQYQQTLTARQIESLATQMVFEGRRIARGEINIPYTMEAQR